MRKLLLIVTVLALTAGVNVGCNKNKADKNSTADGDPDAHVNTAFRALARTRGRGYHRLQLFITKES